MAVMGADPLLEDVLGPFLVGALVSMYCSGLIAGQGRRYFHNFPQDRAAFRYGVVALLLLDLITTIFSAVSTWKLTVNGWGAREVLIFAPWTFCMNAILAGVTTSIVQVFYAYRVFVVSGRRWYLPVPILILSMVQLAFACAASSIGFRYRLSEFVPRFRYGAAGWLGSALAADVLITAINIYYLSKATRRGQEHGFKSSRVFKQIVTVTWETNLGTGVVTMVDLIVFLESSTNWHVALNILMVKCYIMSFLFTLNARAKYASDKDNMAGRVMSLAHHGSYNPSAQNGGIISAAEISAQIDRASVASLRALPKSVSGDGRSFMTTINVGPELKEDEAEEEVELSPVSQTRPLPQEGLSVTPRESI